MEMTPTKKKKRRGNGHLIISSPQTNTYFSNEKLAERIHEKSGFIQNTLYWKKMHKDFVVELFSTLGLIQGSRSFIHALKNQIKNQIY